MNITTVIGKGHVGGGLARLWQQAGHDVKTIAREGGDASGADVIVVAVPSGSIGAALSNVSGNLEVAINQAGTGPFFYRIAKPGEL